MLPLALGVVVLVALLWSMGAFTRLDPKGLAKGAQMAGGVLLLAGAGFLLLRGQIGFALPVGAAGLGMLGWIPWTGGSRSQKTAGQVSRVRSPFFEMELDHDSGAMRGTVIAGRHLGQALDAIELSELLSLLQEIDPESRALLGAYLDRRDARWREHADAGPAAGEAGATHSGKMTEQEAYQILGLEPGASEQDIGRAHRLLMKKVHPDQGGSTYLAAKINEAKDVLLRRHHSRSSRDTRVRSAKVNTDFCVRSRSGFVLGAQHG
jgi:hypothetical protein